MTMKNNKSHLRLCVKRTPFYGFILQAGMYFGEDRLGWYATWGHIKGTRLIVWRLYRKFGAEWHTESVGAESPIFEMVRNRSKTERTEQHWHENHGREQKEQYARDRKKREKEADIKKFEKATRAKIGLRQTNYNFL